ncbi:MULTISPECIES: tRNA preQ1(34) S-adenosylmethionine ribosyltransferase-isomerase QueA [unclassified Pseudodesulfovibrio]|uniref:tRNA preQ1(34) S-adenosylmethionine ribosyltransferase-isomerase QueA n=1 Tax=unclassified Pseudodesulfovibrio TaxID=2661612 RepID=UPI000FEBE231|nr:MULTISPECIES: tRNA preQ1(34) S-adenosylmethionine ribosyltransferase-isomerase QueA [unclassified Pseudodesulfovibrio]MCJ2165160.1 tRNA preQ1(34) S-adenosylmethionine ribosyltransferase-isomerase QueA [Pseudodesulfovibrio sp. S3-i]RWU03388.1 tRNA preQ1(34) S-adenosylmethionine ribosyltransferase-isomerase QueA [Pseudodesulfovibrio sp. S3]
MEIPQDYLLSNYNFELPEDRIAQQPADRRDGSKLLVLGRDDGNLTEAAFTDLLDFLPDNALLVANNSRVIPARIFGAKATGGQVEFLLLTPLPLINAEKKGEWNHARAEGLLRASKGPKPGATVSFGEDFRLTAEAAGEFGRWQVQLQWQGDLKSIFDRLGHLPLPPYIKRPDNDADRERYQTTYSDASKTGSVAAPTAGLHFTPELRQRLADRGIEWAEVTLYVGYGTFSPVRCADIREHRMHAEYIEVPEETASAVRRAKSEGRPVIAVGTTSARTLEGMFKESEEISKFQGETNIFISPGYEFKVIDGILTNFHLPESSLIIMISALAGRKTILNAYAYALNNSFRFFSYGDAMLIV